MVRPKLGVQGQGRLAGKGWDLDLGTRKLWIDGVGSVMGT